MVISAWFVLRGVKRTTHSQAPSEKQHLAYLCLPWPELWAVSTATPTADGKPAVLLFMSVLRNYLPFSILPLLNISLTTTLGTCGTTQLEKVSIPGNLFNIFHNNNNYDGGGGGGRRHLHLACMSPPSPFLTFTNFLLLWLCVGCCWAGSEHWIYYDISNDKQSKQFGYFG